MPVQLPIEIVERIVSMLDIPALEWEYAIQLQLVNKLFLRLDPIKSLDFTNIYVYDATAISTDRKWFSLAPVPVHCLQVHSKNLPAFLDFLLKVEERLEAVKTLTIDCSYRDSIKDLIVFSSNLKNLEKIYFYNYHTYFGTSVFDKVSLLKSHKALLFEPYSPIIGQGTGIQGTSNESAFPMGRRTRKRRHERFLDPPRVPSGWRAVRTEQETPHLQPQLLPHQEWQRRYLSELRSNTLQNLQIKNCLDSTLLTFQCMTDVEIHDHFPAKPFECSSALTSLSVGNTYLFDWACTHTKHYYLSLKYFSINFDAGFHHMEYLKIINCFKNLEILHITFSDTFLIDPQAVLLLTEILKLRKLTYVHLEDKLQKTINSSLLEARFLPCLILRSSIFTDRHPNISFTRLDLISNEVVKFLKPYIKNDIMPGYDIFYLLRNFKELQVLSVNDVFGLKKIIKNDVKEHILQKNTFKLQTIGLNLYPFFEYPMGKDTIKEFIPLLEQVSDLLPNLKVLITGGVVIAFRERLEEHWAMADRFEITGYTI